MRNEINSTPIQDESGIIRFRLENHEHSLNVNVKEERELIKKEVNSRSKHVYDWFKEDTGNKHWVFYDTEMYSIMCDRIGQWKYLNYREESALAQMDGALDKNSTIIDNPANTLHASPTIPINATSCRKMFYGCKSLENIDLSRFDTSKVETMEAMFSNMYALKYLDVSSFSTERLTNMDAMFDNCVNLVNLDLTSFDTGSVLYMLNTFSRCEQLEEILVD